MTLRSSAVRNLGCAIVAISIVFAAAPSAQAAKNHCRKIQLTGNAGAGPNKPVVFFVKNNPGNAVLTESCAVTAGSNESDVNYIKRLPHAWGTSPSNCPPTEIYDPLDPLKSRCVDYGSGSCLIKSKVAPKTTGTSKKYVEICCYEEPECGVKLGTTDLTPIPITIQVEKQGSGNPCPDPNNCEDCDLCVVDPDPMGSQQLPSPAGAKCRAGLSAAMSSYLIGTTQALTNCHKGRMGGSISPATDCNDVNDDPDVEATVDALEAAVTSATQTCAAQRSPSAVGFKSCPPPCNAIGNGGCTAGNGLPTCQKDRDCDTAPGAGDGRCGDWGQAAACLICTGEDAVTTAVTDKYGNPSVSMSPPAQQCQASIGKALVLLAAARIGATSSCQKKLDGGKGSAAQPCKDQDLKGTLAAAEAKIAALVQNACNGATLAELDSICSGATTAAQLGACVVDNARSLNQTFAHAVVPSTARRCGDDTRTGFEQCDGTDDDNCPGQCTPACLCPMPSPVSEDLTPCEPSVIDRWAFQVTAGQNVHVSADTVDAQTAADLCFDVSSDCTTGDTITGDEEIPCTFPSPSSYDCPQDSFVASGNGVCTVAVTECIGDCANPGLAKYTLTVTRDGNPASLALVGDDQP